jgi:PAS domain S-box-containing protein
MKKRSSKSNRPPRNCKRVEDELELHEAKFRVLFDNVSSGVAIYQARDDGRDFVFTDFNRAAEEIEQVKKEELIGRSVLEVFPGVKDFGLFEVFQRVCRTGVPEHHPVSIYRDRRIAGWRENYVYKLPSGEVVAVYDDVTQSKRSELAQRMSEQCFRAIADYSYFWEVWVGPEGRPLWTNPAVHRVTGYTIKELMALPDYPMPIIDEADRGRMGKAFRSALKGSTGNEVRFRLRRKDGRVIWAEMSWQPIYDTEHGSLGHRESIRDISARKEIEEALKKAEHEKETILDGLAERVVYRDRDMRILWANRAACESVGIAREELAGRRCYEALAQRDEPCEDCPVAKAIRTGRAHEVARQMPDGAVLIVRGSPVRDEQGSIIGGVEIALDVTEREHAVEALRPARNED